MADFSATSPKEPSMNGIKGVLFVNENVWYKFVEGKQVTRI